MTIKKGAEHEDAEKNMSQVEFSEAGGAEAPPACSECGMKLDQKDVQLGFTRCFWCDPPWGGTEG